MSGFFGKLDFDTRTRNINRWYVHCQQLLQLPIIDEIARLENRPHKIILFSLQARAIGFKLISQTQPVYVKIAQDLISRMDDKRSKVFNAHQGKFASQWLNVVPCKNPDLRLDDQQLWISIGLRLGANISVANMRHCGKGVERDGLHGLSCTKSAGRFSRHATLNSLMKQTVGSLDLPSMLEPRGLYRTSLCFRFSAPVLSES